MFAKNSRYRRLKDVVTVDARGRRLPCKSPRLTPEVSGDFRHTLEQGDRLDHLAHKYYRQSRKWWRVCDANPEFLSPLALLGEEPVVAARFKVTCLGGLDAPWWLLLRDLSQEVGVERVVLGPDRDMPTVTIVLPPWSGPGRPRPLPAVPDPNLAPGPLPEAWRRALAEQGLEPSARARLEALDRDWLLLDLGETGQLEAQALLTQAGAEPGQVLFDFLRRHRWTAAVTYNRLNIDIPTLLQRINECECTGYKFEAEVDATIGRIGKPIIIPPDTLR